MAVPDRSARPRDLDLSVRSAPARVATGRKVLWILSLRNRTSRALDVTFPDSRYADVVLRQNGRIVYAWSSRYSLHLAVVRVLRLAAGATRVCSLFPDRLNVEPGRYELIAYLASRNAPLRARRWLLVRGPRPFAP